MRRVVTTFTTWRAVGAAACGVLAGCLGPSPETGQASAPDDAAVYAAVLDSMFAGSDAERLIVRESTQAETLVDSDAVRQQALDAFAQLDSSTVASLEAASASTHAIAAIPDTRIPVEIVPDSVFDAFPTGFSTAPDPDRPRDASEYWRAFQDRFPNAAGITGLSAVGYSDDWDQALVAISHGCGSLCGHGSIVLLALRDGAWRVVGISQMWIS